MFATRRPMKTLASLLFGFTLTLGACSDDSAPARDGDVGALDAGGDGLQHDGLQHDGLQPDGLQHDGLQPDGLQHDGLQPDAGMDCDAFTWPVAPTAVSITPSTAWKNTIDIDLDTKFFVKPKAGGGWLTPGGVEWIKFTIFLSDPDKVYFQDSQKYAFHYTFATAHLDPFKGMSDINFNAKTLHKTGQVAVVGAVLLNRRAHEYGVQLERFDAYHPKMVARLLGTIDKSLTFKTTHKPFYLPTFHQQPSIAAARHCYVKFGIEVSDAARWASGSGVYSTGWALGRVVYVDGDKIDDAYKNGTLTYRDILITDAVPAEVPHVAGIVAGTPSTPNAHVAILAQTFGVPFAYSKEAFKVGKALAGKEAVLRVREEVDLVEPLYMDTKTRAYLEGLKKPAPIAYKKIAKAGMISRPVAGLTPADVPFVGGKAAGFGVLHQAIPAHTPTPAIALTFDLYTAFLSQTLKSGKTLRQTIDDTLSGVTWPPNIQTLATKLKGLRDTIEDDAVFSASQRSALIALLAKAGFDPKTKVRFRSSTNVEDGAHFTGAGLYESKSGCVADDTDNDEKGPSLCDSTKKDERGIFLAIRKVYASFFNDNAYLERLRHGVKETEVGMAVLVHYSFPDPDELANGVIVYRHRKYGASFEIVSQRGATSVTNPQPGVIPEVVRGSFSSIPGRIYWDNISPYSSLPPLGKPVLDFPKEYEDLAHLVDDVRKVWAAQNGQPTGYALDMEYKKIKPNKLVIKQVRFLPQEATEKTLTPVIVAAPYTYCPLQGETSNIYALHRLKSRWVLGPRTVMLDAQGRKASFYADINTTYRLGGKLITQKGDPATWTAAKHTLSAQGVTDTFVVGAGATQRTMTLSVNLPDKVSPRDTPILLLKDVEASLNATYVTPVPYVDPLTHKPATRTMDSARLSRLCLDAPTASDDSEQTRTIAAGKGLTIGVAFFWPPGPTGASAGYTAPLIAWKKVTITGLTTVPIDLDGFYSRTYRPGHHNFNEFFAFEPRYDPKTSPATLAELATQNIRTLIFNMDTHAGTLHSAYVIGTDEKLRAW
ncbi:MAG: hypothetical protein KAI47_02845 [Deltaproteobacteria bacterium]|nr:hypothetical protein [Deltaproteobacteria bacterium]